MHLARASTDRCLRPSDYTCRCQRFYKRKWRKTMNQPFYPEADLPISALLEQLDSYMHALAWRTVPRQALAAETVDLDVEDIVQNTRIKLWLALEREQKINNTRAYVRSIV